MTVTEMIGRSEEELISLHQKHQLEWPSPHFHPRGYLSKKKSPLSTSSPRHLPPPPPPPQHRWRAMILECYYKFQCCLATGWWITIGAERGGDLTLFMRVSVCAYVCVCVCVWFGGKREIVCVCVCIWESVMTDRSVCGCVISVSSPLLPAGSLQ